MLSSLFSSICGLLSTQSRCCKYEITSNNTAKEEQCVVPLTVEEKKTIPYVIYTFLTFHVECFSFWMVVPFSFLWEYGEKEQRVWIIIPTSSCLFLEVGACDLYSAHLLWPELRFLLTACMEAVVQSCRTLAFLP